MPTANTIEYLIASEFDTLKGPIILQTFPKPILGDLPYFAELLLPDQVHNREEDWTVIILHPKDPNLEGPIFYEYSSSKNNEDSDPLYILNVVDVRFDETVHRNTIIKGLAIATRSQAFHIYKPLLLFTLDKIFKINSNDQVNLSKILDNLFHNINNSSSLNDLPKLSFEKKLLLNSIVDFPIKDYLSNKNFSKKLFNNNDDKSCYKIKNNEIFEVLINFENLKIPLRVPFLQLPDVVGDYPIKDFLKKFLQCSTANVTFTAITKNPELFIYGQSTPVIVILINAFLTHKRIFFLGTGLSAHEIIESVFATISLVSGGGGIIKGLLKKTFPYIDLSKFDMIEAQSWFFAGTANPTFKTHDELYDLLYDIELNELIISEQAKPFIMDNIDEEPLKSPISLTFPGIEEENDMIQEQELQSPISISSGFSFSFNNLIIDNGNSNSNSNSRKGSTNGSQAIINNNPIIVEDANFLKKLTLLINDKHDDETMLLTFRQHINNIMRILTTIKLFSCSTKDNFLSSNGNNPHWSHDSSLTMSSYTGSTTSKQSSITTNDSFISNKPHNNHHNMWINTSHANKHSKPNISINCPTNNRPGSKDCSAEKEIGYFWSSKLEKITELKVYLPVFKAYSIDNNPLTYYFEPDTKEVTDVLYLLNLLESSPLSTAKILQIYQQFLNEFSSSQNKDRFLLSTYLLSNPFDNESLVNGRNRGLDIICLGLYHKDEKVREAAKLLIKNIEKDFLGKVVVKNGTNPFFQLALD